MKKASKSHLEPRGSKSVTKTRFLKVPNSGCIPGLACLADLGLLGSPRLASHWPRSPCLHQQRQQRRCTPPGRQRRPGCCCEVQARRARPIRGEVSQARQGQGPSTFFLFCLFGPWAFYLAYGLGPPRYFYLRGPCIPGNGPWRPQRIPTL